MTNTSPQAHQCITVVSTTELPAIFGQTSTTDGRTTRQRNTTPQSFYQTMTMQWEPPWSLASLISWVLEKTVPSVAVGTPWLMFLGKNTL